MTQPLARTTPPRARAAVRTVLSVVIPVYNSRDNLAKCLDALAASDYPSFEVLVVDDGSTELLGSVVAAHGYRYLRIVGPQGPARARNYGAAHVTGQYLVFIDADVCVHPDTLTRIATTFEADPSPAAVVGSYDDTPAASNFLSQYKNLFHHYVHQHAETNLCTFWSGCGAIRRDLFLELGGFDAQRYRRPAIEDIEFGTRLAAAGHRIVLDRQITATHLKRWTLRSVIKTDIFDRGIPWVRLMWRLGALANTLNVTWSQRLSVALVYGVGLGILATLRWPEARIVVALLGLLVLLVNQHFYRYMATQRSLWFALRVVPLHWLYFAYCGFCVVWGTALHYFRRPA